jgi:DNA-binding NtrC family response regulator
MPLLRVSVPVRAIAAEVVAGDGAGARVVASEEPLSIGSAEGNALRLGDPTVSAFHLELSPAHGGIRVRDLGSTNGTAAGSIRLHDAVVASGTVVTIGRTTVRVLDEETRSVELGEPVEGLVGASPSAHALARRVRRAAASTAPVLIEGESGTGKERVAAALHALSARRDGPLVIVDCGAIAPGVVASELFGHAKGAFTGAREAHVGALSRASGGTIFLDEIGELAPAVQPLLVGALARGELRPLGGGRDVPFDVRVIAATHRDLRAAVNDGTFRADLYHRLAVIRIPVAPLRARPDDIEPLIDHFLRARGFAGERRDIVSDAVLEQWCAHSWPGNVRELRNAVESALALREAPELETPVRGAFAEILGLPFREARDHATDRFERRYLEALLARTRENVAEAARVAELDRTHLHDLLKRHALR